MGLCACEDMSTVSDWNELNMTPSLQNKPGHTSTPTSQEAIRNSPVLLGFRVSPHACFDIFADVSMAQSIAVLRLNRIYVLMCGAARFRPPSPRIGASKISSIQGISSSLEDVQTIHSYLFTNSRVHSPGIGGLVRKWKGI